MANADMRLMKEINLNRLRAALKQKKSATKPELTRLTGLSVMTVNTLVKELCASGEFTEEKAAASSGGRPAAAYQFNARHRLVLAICAQEHFGKNKVFITVSDLYGEYLEQSEVLIRGATLDFFEDIVDACLLRHKDIGVIAFGMPGREVGNRILVIDFPELIGTGFSEHFKNKYGLPVIFENEVNAAVAGFYKNKTFSEGTCVSGLYLPKNHGPGASACINGEVYRGRDGAAGEVIFLETEIKRSYISQLRIDYTKVNVRRLVTDMILPMIVFLNPDFVVIYGQWLPDNILDGLKRNLLRKLPEELLPEMNFIPDIRSDFIDGMIHLALKTLEPKISP